MTQKQVHKLVRDWQRRLGLERWRITLEFSDEPEDFHAQVTPSAQYESAAVIFAPGYGARSDEAVAHTVVHELLHVLLRDVDAVVSAATDQLHPQAAGQIDKRYAHEIEGFVDALARRITEPGWLSPAQADVRAAAQRPKPRRSRAK